MALAACCRLACVFEMRPRTRSESSRAVCEGHVNKARQDGIGGR